MRKKMGDECRAVHRCYGALHFPASRKAAAPSAVAANMRVAITVKLGVPICDGGDQTQP
jgi:hypothetical protein